MPRPDTGASDRLALAEARRRLEGVFSGVLGDDGYVLDARLQDAIDAPRLARVLQDGLVRVRQRLGAAASDALAKRLYPEPDGGAKRPDRPL